MLKITVIAIGKIRQDYIKQGLAEFEKRLKPYVRLNIIEIEALDGVVKNNSHQLEKVKQSEGKKILKALDERAYVIALAIKGKPTSSLGLARSINNLQVKGHSHLTFIIGGAFGLADEVLGKANHLLSLSHLTFTHEMVRLIFLEQLYRVYKILNNEPYHY